MPHPENLDGEIRTDYRTGSKVFFSSIRNKKPMDFTHNDSSWTSDVSKCPFEPGREDLNKTISYIGGDESSWRLRTIENKFPLIFPGPGFHSSIEFFEKSTPFGYSEVLIESRQHELPFEEISEDDLVLWLDTVADREEELYSKEHIKYVYMFKNEGPRSGASLFHPHSQIMAFSEVPPVISSEISMIKKHLEENGACLYEYAMDKEKERTLLESDSCVAIAPFGSKFSGESVIMPKRHVNYSAGLSRDERIGIVRMIKKILITNKKIFGRVSYNMLFHEIKSEEDFHFHIEICPRVITFAAVEFLGFFTNQITPERYREFFMDNSGV